MERGKVAASSSIGNTVVGTVAVPQLLCLSLHESDKIRVMNLSANSIAALRTVIKAGWQQGIQWEGFYGISYEFKLCGRPWEGSGEQANSARRLIAGVFGFLLQQEWVLRVACDLSKWTRDKDTFYFKHEALPNPDECVCAVSFNRTDTMRVIGGPPEVAQVVRSTIRSYWYRGLQHECVYCGAPDFKLNGDPWAAQGTETMQMRMFIGQLIEALDRAGWELYASVDISSGSFNRSGYITDYGMATSGSNKGDLDSWILRRKIPPLLAPPVIGIPAETQTS